MVQFNLVLYLVPFPTYKVMNDINEFIHLQDPENFDNIKPNQRKAFIIKGGLFTYFS